MADKVSIAVSTDTSSRETVDASVCTEELEGSVLLPEVERLKTEIEQSMMSQSLENEMLSDEIKVLKEHIQTLEECNSALQSELKEQEMIVTDKIDARKRRQAAQTNSRLMNVLSDLVKTFVDTEQNIQSQLCNLGLAVQQSDGSGTADDENGPTSGNFYGSKEDVGTFPLVHGEGLTFEMCDDGLDLTPRAWDAFAVAIGHQEVETEGEDVVLGASRRLRVAVEHVLALLNELSETQQYQKIVELLHKNEELMMDLKEEEQSKRHLHLDLVKAEDVITCLKGERQTLEEKLQDIEERHGQLLIELKATRERVDTLEVSHVAVVEDKLLLEEQQKLLTSDMNNSGLKIALEKNSLLNTEKRSLQHKHDADRQRLLGRIHQLELSVEEITALKDEILDEKQREIEDLKTQMEAMEKQMLSNKKFIEEQVHEREQEQEDFQRELDKMKGNIKGKDRNQENEHELSKELESLEQQLKGQNARLKETESKREEIEKQFRLTTDKVKDLQDVISELENQLDAKSKLILEQNQSLTSLKEALAEHEAVKDDFAIQIKELECTSMQEEINEHIQSLDEQLESRNQELRQMAHCQSMLQEFRSQIRVLDEKVESKLRQIECFFAHLCLSPVPSEDNSCSDSVSKDIEDRLMLIQEERVLSPSSVQWEELKRLESKIDTLLVATDDAMKRLKEFEARMRLIKHNAEELQTEKSILQQQLSDQLFQISSLKTRIEDKRYETGRTKSSSGLAQELTDLKERLSDEIRQQHILKQKLHESSSTIDFLQKQLQGKGQQLSKLEEEMFESACLREKQVQKMEELCKEIDELRSSQTDLTNIETQTSTVRIELLETEAQTDSVLAAPEEPLQPTLVETLKEESELAQKQNEQLEAKLHLEKDFDTVQLMLKEKEDEIVNLQQESEAHLLLEKEIVLLRENLSEEQTVRLSRETEIQSLEREMDELKQCIALMKEKTHQQEFTLKTLETELAAMNHKYAAAVLPTPVITTQNEVLTTNASVEESPEHQKLVLETELLKKQCLQQIKLAEDQFRKKLASESNLLGQTYEQSLTKIRDQHEQSMKDLERQLSASFAREVEYVRVSSKNELEEELLKKEHELSHRDETHRTEIERLKQECKNSVRKLVEQHQAQLSHLKSLNSENLLKELENVTLKETSRLENLALDYETRLAKLTEDNKMYQEQLDLLANKQQNDAQSAVELENLRVIYENKKFEVQTLDLKVEEYKTENGLKDREIEQLKLQLSLLRDELQRVHSSLLLSRENTPESSASSRSNGDEGSSSETGKLPRNIQRLFDKVLKEGLEVLSLSERHQLQRHVTPEPVTIQSSHGLGLELWTDAKDQLLVEVKAFKDLVVNENEEKNKVAESMAVILRDFLKREKTRLLLELQAYAAWEGQKALSNCKELEEKLYNIEDRQEAALKELYLLVHSQLNKEKNSNLHLEGQISLLTEQVERGVWQIEKQRDLLEYRTKQEKILHNEFQVSIQREQLNSEQLNTKLKEMHQKCSELELKLSMRQAEFNKQQHILESLRKETESYRNTAEVEKKHAHSLLQALESERANFTQLHIALDSEREHRSKENDRNLTQILKLQALRDRQILSAKTSGTVSPEIARLPDAEMGVDMTITSMLSRNSQNAIVTEKCSKCGFFESILIQERDTWKRHEETMNQLLQKTTKENTELKHQVQTISEKTDSASQRQKLLQLHWKYRRCEKHRSSLVYQKRYLLKLLQGYQSTESAALSVLTHMGVCTPVPSLPGSFYGSNGHTASTAADQSLIKPSTSFRGAARAVVAMLRFRLLSDRSKQAQQFFFLGLQQLPPASAAHHDTHIGTRLQSQLGDRYRGDHSTRSSTSSNSSTQSAPWSRMMHTFMRDSSSTEHHNHAPSEISDSPRVQGSNSGLPRSNSKLQECVLRLESLHKTLGLDGPA